MESVTISHLPSLIGWLRSIKGTCSGDLINKPLSVGCLRPELVDALFVSEVDHIVGHLSICKYIKQYLLLSYDLLLCFLKILYIPLVLCNDYDQNYIYEI